jgi:guanosine-3',5'-bis(diphosphate) 3'-pyrophosphohydrolase
MNYTALIKKIESYNSNFDRQQVIKAFKLAKKAHGNQMRASGEPYYYHPIYVAMILAEMHLDEETIITALLHDTLEDTSITLEDLQVNFGTEIAKLVDGVTKLAKIKFQPDNIREGESFRKLLMAMSEDIRVLIVKLADRLHNMRTINFLSKKKATRIAIETLEIYAPLAERIGMHKIKNELQDLAFEILHPEERKSILNRIEYLRADEGLIIDKIETHIKKTLSDFGITVEVEGREKAPYSIWQKMKQKNVSFEQLSDVIAFRVIVNDLIDCYQVLGITHAAYKMIPENFKDYISNPKSNGYSSLHTVVVGPNKQKIEIQIKTQEMHYVNEWGVAAHWGYKQDIDLMKNPTENVRFKWIKELINILDHSETEDFIEHTKLAMYEDQVFCFTPKGEIIALPKGATPIDFAYALHTDIGNACAGAKINGRPVPLKTALSNGDQVEISIGKTSAPSALWKQFVITAKAKSEIKRFMRSKQKKEYIVIGKNILSKFFIQEKKEFKEEYIRDHLHLFHKKNLDELYMSIGEGSIDKKTVMEAVCKTTKSKLYNLKESLSFFKLNKNKNKPIRPAVLVKDKEQNSIVNFAKCCNPLPGDLIIGVMDKKKNILIHAANCNKLNEEQHVQDNLVEVVWDKYSKDHQHLARLKMTISNEVNSLANITSIIARYGCNINNLTFTDRSSDFFDLLIELEVPGISQLTNIIATLRAEECVHIVDRFKEY